MKTVKYLFSLLVTVSIFTACNVEPLDGSLSNNPGNSSFVGNYLLTEFNSSVPVDINLDSNFSNNLLNETNCFAGSYLKINANNTFEANQKGIDIELVGTNDVITCFEDPIISGTWILNGNVLSLSYVDGLDIYTDDFVVESNKLTYSVQGGEVVGTTSTGEPVYLTSNIDIIYTK